MTKSQLPAILKANIVSADQINQTINASGNVEISKESSVIYANEVSYDKKNKIISGSGNIIAKNLEIGRIIAPNFDIKDDFSSGNFYLAKIFFADGSYLISDQISRLSPLKSNLKNSSFSICPNEEIANDNSKINNIFDFIKIKSSQTTIDREKNNFVSKNTIIKIYEVPILYFPYFKFPLPATKRQTGLLQPSYIKNSNFGLGFNMPLFINVNKNSDLTISPTYYFSTNQIIVSNDWRQKIKYGSYNLNLELANNNIENNNIDKMIIKRSHKPIRWQINGVGNFNFTKNWGMDYAVQNISDRNYLRDYNFNYLAYTNSKINFDYINSRSYFGIKSMKFQEIENNNLEKTAPTILPSINTSFETSPLFFKEKFILATNFTSIKRDQGLQYNRGTIVPSFKFPFNIKGNLFEFSAKMQNDFYVLNDKDLRNYSDQKIYKSFQSDLKREMSINWRLPLRNKSLNRTITIEPMANFVVSDYKSKNSNIPLEDSINSELTFSNLFVNDRISGFDRNEAGQRISYGLKSSIFNKLGELNFTAGQAMIIKKNDQDIKIRGFAENNKSNIVGIVSFKGKKYFSISYSFQLDQVNYRNDVNQVFANLNYKKFDFTVDYLLIRKNINNLKEREQATFINSFELFEKWYFKTFLTRDFVEKRNIQRGIEITRNGCCSNFGFSIVERNQSSLTKPQKTFNINFTIKNL